MQVIPTQTLPKYRPDDFPALGDCGVCDEIRGNLVSYVEQTPGGPCAKCVFRKNRVQLINELTHAMTKMNTDLQFEVDNVQLAIDRELQETASETGLERTYLSNQAGWVTKGDMIVQAMRWAATCYTGSPDGKLTMPMVEFGTRLVDRWLTEMGYRESEEWSRKSYEDEGRDWARGEEVGLFSIEYAEHEGHLLGVKAFTPPTQLRGEPGEEGTAPPAPRRRAQYLSLIHI